jgi:stage II sporulation protein D
VQHPEWKSRVNRAILGTRGEVLLDVKSRTLKAFYSADCGCQSEDPKYVWGPLPSFESVKDPLCGKRAPTLWKLTLERVEVRTKLLALLDLPADAGLRALNIEARTPSGRVASLMAVFKIGKTSRKFTLRAQQFRQIIGFHRVRSAAFTMRWLGEELEISGNGIGHGVGLCQTGARGLAENGMNYRDILKLYYPRASLRSPRQI